MKDVKITQVGKEKADVIIDFIKYLLFFMNIFFYVATLSSFINVPLIPLTTCPN